MTEDNSIKLQGARLRAIVRAPYLATALWGLQPRATPGMGTMGVSKGWTLYYDPAVLEKWDVEGLATVLVHEVWHVLRAHCDRAENMGVNPEDRSLENQYRAYIWNIACDMEINDDLVDEKMPFPEGTTPVLPKDQQFKPYLTAEVYFDQLQKNKNVQQMMKELQELDKNPLRGADGSGATGLRADWESDEAEKEATGRPEGLDKGNAELIRQQVAHDIAKTAGDTPGHAKRWADKQLNPKINWKQRLAAQVRNAVQWASGMSDYTYTKMSRRSVCVPRVVLPSLKAPVPSVAVAIDTSGSMSQGDLAAALAETKGILESTGVAIEVFAVDAKVHNRQKVFSPKEIKLVGGGGTDMGEAIEAAEEMPTPPSILIIMTDGFTPWPAQKPKRVGKVIVCLLTSERNTWGKPERPPKWTEVIEVEHEE